MLGLERCGIVAFRPSSDTLSIGICARSHTQQGHHGGSCDDLADNDLGIGSGWVHRLKLLRPFRRLRRENGKGDDMWWYDARDPIADHIARADHEPTRPTDCAETHCLPRLHHGEDRGAKPSRPHLHSRSHLRRAPIHITCHY